METFIKHIEKILKVDDRLWSKDDDKKLLKNKLIELVSNDDEELLELLLNDSEAKKHFFKKIKDSTIFLKDRFLQFTTMNEFLPDSFTAFENEIGLSDDKKLITQKDEISLIFPHKDCFLEGGQTKEEAGRDEIFYNTILAPDEIDRIKEPKVLVNWKRFDKDGKHEVKEISKQDNLIIKGNNLLALYSLLPKYRGEIKLIYIDPPYNTDTDSFLYNDRFNHSAWLIFVQNRLEVAKELLADDGVIFVQCDDNEQAYLKVLMDSIFKNSFLNTISVKAKVSAGASGGGEDKKIKKNIEYIHCYCKSSFSAFNDVFKETEITSYIQQMKNDDKSFKYTSVLISTGSKKHFKTIKDGSGEDITIYKHSDIKTKTISQILKQENMSLEDVYKKYFDKIFTTTNAQSSIRQRVWDTTGNTNEFYSIEYTPKSGKNKGKLITQYYTGNKKVLLIWFKDTALIDEEGDVIKREKYGTFWDGIDYNNLNKEGGILFASGKKPEQLVKRIIEMTTDKNEIVLDFFAGAGTTGAVAHKMGRRYILVEQMDYIHDLPEARLKNVINGDQTGISKVVNWKGGGSFIYAELLEWNQKYISQLEKAKTAKAVLDIYKKIEKEQFYKYKYEPKKFNLKKFKELGLKEQKKALLDILDMNHLYVNKSSMNDTTFKVEEKDKKLTKKFYEEK